LASEAPPFWWQKADWRAWALWPASLAYGAVAAARMRRAKREQIDIPVLCIGNFTVGGSGKTPVTIALAKAAKAMGHTPGILSRGYGGSFKEPHIVDLKHDLARHVGDEPLLLAEHAPVAVTPDRAAGARLLKSRGCDLILMDDGFQSARIAIDYALLVVDAHYGLGNSHVIPGGPLRAPLVDQLRFTTAIAKVGEGDRADEVVRKAARAGRSMFQLRLKPRGVTRMASRRFLAFAGIGHPEKFFATVRAAGGEVKLARAFADHHFYADDELRELLRLAKLDDLDMITTAKDAARLRSMDLPEGFAEKVSVLEIEAIFEFDQAAARIIDDTFVAWRRRRGVA